MSDEQKTSHFFAYLSRLKYIYRWPLMRNIVPENVAEHSLRVAFITHMLAVIKNKQFSGRINVERTVLFALYHDISEVITGDLPTPIKYFSSALTYEYKKIEFFAKDKLFCSLPKIFQDEFSDFIMQDYLTKDEENLVKQADTICAYLKAVEEFQMGNNEFSSVKKRLKLKLDEFSSPEVDYFLTIFLPSFQLNFDQINQ